MQYRPCNPACESLLFCAALYAHLWPVWLYHIFLQYLKNGMIFGKRLWNIKCVFWFPLQSLSEIFLIRKIIQRDSNINALSVHVKYSLLWSHFNETNFLDRFFKSPQVSNLMKISQVMADMFHADGRTDGQILRHNEVNSRFLNFANLLRSSWDDTPQKMKR
jgi:hypothetical protein